MSDPEVFQLMKDIGVKVVGGLAAQLPRVPAGALVLSDVGGLEEVTRYVFDAQPSPVQLAGISDLRPRVILTYGEEWMPVELNNQPFGVALMAYVVVRDSEDCERAIAWSVRPGSPAELMTWPQWIDTSWMARVLV